jgi:chromate transporter
VIAVNTATFIGQRLRGVVGGVVATLGVVFPSLIIITVIAAFIQNFSDMAVVKNAFAGVRVCVCVLVFNAVVKLWKKSVTDKRSLMIFLLVFLLSVFTSVSPLIFVLLSGAAGVLLTVWEGRRTE